MSIDWSKELTRTSRGGVSIAGIPIAMHCHHYNINLQKMLEETPGVDGVKIMVEAAEESTFIQFNAVLRDYPQIRTLKSKLELAETIYQNCGMGLIRFTEVSPRRAKVVSPSGHIVTGWLAKHGRRKNYGCFFTRGWIAGVLESCYKQPLGYYKVKETACKLVGDQECVFVVEVRDGH